ncbi:hypothetical protein ACHHYP_16838 [Achlya hypogyna]|uniref:FYVE-type domain-containing protein n=1 Tax=Achlya hypogyna TaxID=1202772 RepID=A0A1V9Y5L0_ACHHY|nr:hypothetical protein ACHHYP_16838 [Achlya hypogyna]
MSRSSRQQQDVISLDQLVSQDEWIPDTERFRCHVCTRNFSNFRRKHHCRMCGEVVCSSCTLKKLAQIPQRQGLQEVKVCMSCILAQGGPSNPRNTTETSMTAPSSTRSRPGSIRSDSRLRGSTMDRGLDSPTDDKRHFSNADMEMDYPLDFSWGYQWPKPPVLPNESDRLAALRSFDILDTAQEDVFDIICDLASNALKCPIAVVSLMDTDRQWFKASVGLAQTEIPRNVSFCAHTIRTKEPMVVLDTLLDKRFAKNPLVTGGANIRFYAGSPIVSPSGHVLGTVFVFDTQPRHSCDITTLEKLSNVAMKNIEDRKNAIATPVASATPPPPAPTSTALTEAPAPNLNTQDLVVQNAGPGDGQVVAGPKLETMLMDLLCRTTETQQQLATQQGAMFQTLGQHTAQIDKLADAAVVGAVITSLLWHATMEDVPRRPALLKSDLLPPAEYIPTKDCLTCYVCMRKFNLLRHKHNCALCGEVMCSKCFFHVPVTAHPVERYFAMVCAPCYKHDERLGPGSVKIEDESGDESGGDAGYHSSFQSNTSSYHNSYAESYQGSYQDHFSVGNASLYSSEAWSPERKTSFASRSAFDSLRSNNALLEAELEASKAAPAPRPSATATIKSTRHGPKWPTKVIFVHPEELQKDFAPKSKRQKCDRCRRSFTLFRHKYQCQTCGEVFCSHCTTNQLALRPDGQSSFDVTVCWTCVHISTVQGNYHGCRQLQKAVMALFHDPHYPPPNTAQVEHQVLRLEAAHVVPYDRLMKKAHWVSLKDRSNCRACHDKFRFIMRKDHCRLAFCFMCLFDILVSDVPRHDEWQVAPICQSCSTSTTKRVDESTVSRYVAPTGSRVVRSRASSADAPNVIRPTKPAARPPSEYRRGSNPEMNRSYPLDFSWGCQWPKAPTLPNELERLAALHDFEILDTPREDVFDIICELASNALKCPIAAVSLIDADRQWFKASVGLAQTEIPRDVAFCAHTIVSQDTMIVLDALRDRRFVMNPLVTGPAGVRFYAGTPIVTSAGHVIGTVFVFDNEPRRLGFSDIATLEKLAAVAMKNIEERKEIWGKKLSPLPSVPETVHEEETVEAVADPAVTPTTAITQPSDNMEAMLMALLCRTTDTQQALASQQCVLFQTLGQHTAEIDRLASVARRMEAMLAAEKRDRYRRRDDDDDDETFVLR